MVLLWQVADCGLQVCTTSSSLGGNWWDLKHGLVLCDDQMASPRQLIVPSTQVRLPQTLEKWCVVWEQPPCLACELLSSSQQVLCMRPKHYSRTPIVRIKHVTYIFVPCSSSKRWILLLSAASKSSLYPRLVVGIVVSATLAPFIGYEGQAMAPKAI